MVKMTAKKNPNAMVAGVLLFLGSLVYLYVFFTWYSTGVVGAWLSAASFLGPFVAAAAVVVSFTLLFLSLGTASGKLVGEKMRDMLWRYIMIGGMSLLIVSAGGTWFYYVVVGFLLTFIGGMLGAM